MTVHLLRDGEVLCLTPVGRRGRWSTNPDEVTCNACKGVQEAERARRHVAREVEEGERYVCEWHPFHSARGDHTPQECEMLIKWTIDTAERRIRECEALIEDYRMAIAKADTRLSRLAAPRRRPRAPIRECG